MISVMFELDRYYTPETVARRILEYADLPVTPSICADSTCGNGRLLAAANEVFGGVECVGIDRDSRIISLLRRSNPDWRLTVGDLLNVKRYSQKFADFISPTVDLLILNPPFSQGNRKAVDITYRGNNIKGSVAMAYLLRSFELFGPTHGAVAIVPESLLYSETDTFGRTLLSESYSIQKLAELESHTFKGARAHATVIQILPSDNQICTKLSTSSLKSLRVRLTRGALPVHLMQKSSRGVPFVHSTDIKKVIDKVSTSDLIHTEDCSKGRISGWVILVPRVGLPEKRIIQAVNFGFQVQLSDCVLALECKSKIVALELEKRIHESWDGFRDLYKGTGARYVTRSRLSDWLASKCVNIEFG